MAPTSDFDSDRPNLVLPVVTDFPDVDFWAHVTSTRALRAGSDAESQTNMATEKNVGTVSEGSGSYSRMWSVILDSDRVVGCSGYKHRRLIKKKQKDVSPCAAMS